jgi:hypothetical protein
VIGSKIGLAWAVFDDGYNAYIKSGAGTARMAIEVLSDSDMWHLQIPEQRYPGSYSVMILLDRTMSQAGEMVGGGQSQANVPVRRQPLRRAKNQGKQVGGDETENDDE